MTRHVRIGIDFGGTKIEGIALARDGRVLDRRRVATPRSYEASLDAVAGLVAALEAAAGAAAGSATVGVGIPGAISPATGLVKNANSTWLTGHPFDRDLAERLRRPVRMMNDANCFALSEAADGAAAGAGVVFGVILGTGVGGGIVVDGRSLDGANRIAGEWGHNALPWPAPDELPGPRCYCGRDGCIEAFLSGPSLERDHAAHADGVRSGGVRSDGARSDGALSSRDVVRLAQAGDAAALATMARYHHRLARALSSVINVLDPDVVVLGGGMSNVPGLVDAVRPLLARWVFSDTIATRLVRHAHGDSSGVRGAAWLWPLDGGGA